MFDVLEPQDPRQVGRYRIVARIGAGGMGRVYLGRSPGGRPVAVKVVRPELARDGDFRRRFAREVAAARRVNGAFTAGVVDADPDGSPAWLATVYVAGVPLGEAVARYGPWPAEAVRALGAGLAEALEAIHAAGVVHRDLKPSNVLLASDGPRVIDFGISSASGASALTRTGTTIGTPGFMSPEQLTGRPVGPAGDVFALGAVLAYTAAGVGPFGDGTPHALHFRAVYEPPDLGALPPGLREVVADCLAKEPDDRPAVADLLHRMTSPAPGEEADATLSLSGPGWMPDAVGRLVREKAADAPPRVPSPPPTAPDVPAVPQETTPDPPAKHTPPTSSAPPQTRSLPTAPVAGDRQAPARGVHEAPTETADPAARGVAGASGPAAEPAGGPLGEAAGEPADGSAGPAPSPHPRPDATPLSRRTALLALTGTALAAAVAVTGWKLSEGGSGSAGPPTIRRPARTTAPPARTPGQRIWAFRTDGEVHSSPAVADGAVYFGSNDDNLYAVDAVTGRKRWSLDTGNVCYSSPAVVGGVVYVGTADNGLYAVDAATGRKRWAFPADTGGSSSPVVADGVVYLGSEDEHIYALDAVTGRRRWSFRCRKAGLVDSSPTLADGVVYATSEDRCLYALDAATGRKRWAFTVGESLDWHPAVAGGLVYVSDDDGHLYAVDAATGKQRWSVTGPRHKVAGAGHRAFSSPTVAGGVVYVGDEIEYLYALDAATGAKRWTFTTGNSVFPPPAVVDGVVYFGSDDKHLYALDAVTGRKRWAFGTGDGVEAAPTVAGGAVYFGSKDGYLYAVKT